MDMEDYSAMWKTIENYFFPICKELLLPLSCCLCGNLAINAYQPRCKCNYCFKCLDLLFIIGSGKCMCGIKFLGDGDHSIRESIIPAKEINKQISKLKVKCPVKGCTFRTELININEHLEICGKKEVKCNFQLVGCDKKLIDDTDLLHHLNESGLPHNKLLIKWIFNKTSKLSIDFMDLKDQILEKELVDLDKRLSRIMTLANDENEEKQAEIDQLKSDVINIKNRNKEFGKFTRKIHDGNEKQNKVISELKQSIEIQNKEMANLREIIQNQNEENCRIKNILRDLMRQISPASDQIDNQILKNSLESPHLEIISDLSSTNIPSILKVTKVDNSDNQSKLNETVKVKLNSKNKRKIKKVDKPQLSTIKSETISLQSNQNIQNKPIASNYISTQRNLDFYDDDPEGYYDDDQEGYNDIYDDMYGDDYDDCLEPDNYYDMYDDY